MTLIRSAIRYPVTTTVGVILVVLFGSIALFRLPIQLTPDVEQPVIGVQTVWPGASPYEIEREIIDEQEKQLKSIEGLVKMTSSSRDGSGHISLHFAVGTDRDEAVLKVSNRLDQVESYPTNVEKPVILGKDDEEDAIAWFEVEPVDYGPDGVDVTTQLAFVEDFVIPEFERIPGVASSNVFGGKQEEVHVIVDPAQLALRRITLTELAEAIDRENRNFSGGDFNEGKRRYVVRTVGEYQSPEDVENIVIAVRSGVPVYLRDVARVELGYAKVQSAIFNLRAQVLAINIQKQAGANVIDIMEEVSRRVEKLNSELLEPRGMRIQHNWNQTGYINSAIALVRNNLLIGSALAVCVLLLFLRNAGGTVIAAVAIPISVIGTFLMMSVFGRTLNVISLAGMAFAAGMVVDNSIVVLENIYRHRQAGRPMSEAAYEGAREVWGAVLASTLTTIAVFAPVVFIQEEVGQLFGDIAVAISCAVAISLLVSITVIPMLAARWLRMTEAREETRRPWWGLRAARRISAGISAGVAWINSTVLRRLAVIVGGTAAAVLVSFAILPESEYLPKGDTDYLFAIMVPPPGYNIDELKGLGTLFADGLAPLGRFEEGSAEAEELPAGGINSYFMGVWQGLAFAGIAANDPSRIRELMQPFRDVASRVPGAIAFIDQWGIFEGVGSGSRQIDVEIKGPDLHQLIALGREAYGMILQALPDAQAFPGTGLDLGSPEVRIVTDRRRATELGISNRDLGFTVDALVDGAKVSDYRLHGREIDLKVMANDSFAQRTHLLEQMPIATPDGRLVSLGSVARVEEVSGPVRISHRERQRTLTIEVTPAEQMPTETAVRILRDQLIKPLTEAGKLGGLYSVALSGSADSLEQAADTLKWNFLLAVAITYLLMAALFESFLYPFVIMFSVPLAAMGGFLGLALVNLLVKYQPLDVLTMLGFIILVGTVVNNAILLVHQSLNHIRGEAMEVQQAIREAVRTRIRPIFMSVGTTSLAMTPLIIAPGAGSELYRGLGAVVVGGLLVSTVFTLFLVPALLSLLLEFRQWLALRLHSSFLAETGGGPGGQA